MNSFLILDRLLAAQQMGSSENNAYALALRASSPPFGSVSDARRPSDRSDFSGSLATETFASLSDVLDHVNKLTGASSRRPTMTSRRLSHVSSISVDTDIDMPGECIVTHMYSRPCE